MMTMPGRGGTVAAFGAAAGIGVATAHRLAAAGYRVITVDVRDADVACDLGIDEGRRPAAHVSQLAHGVLDGLVQAPRAARAATVGSPRAVDAEPFGTGILVDTHSGGCR